MSHYTGKAYLEHLAAAASADTLQLGVPGSLHVHSLGILTRSCLLPLFRHHGLLLLLPLYLLKLLLLLLLLQLLLLDNCLRALLVISLLLLLLLLLLCLPCSISSDWRCPHTLLGHAAVAALAWVCCCLRGSCLRLRLQRPANIAASTRHRVLVAIQLHAI
jgi:hypothetical protein